MSTCSRCGAVFSCAMADASAAPCWCVALPPAVAVPAPVAGVDQPATCWCPACLRQHIDALTPPP